MEKTKALQIKELTTIPGVGKIIAHDLWNIGYRSIRDLKGQNAGQIYIQHNDYRGKVQDICMLYTFRCAVYYADTLGDVQDPEKLKWWNWMDSEKMNSEAKDKQLREL